MLLTKFRGNRPAGSGEEYFRNVFTIYERPCWSCDKHHVIRFNISLYLKAFVKIVVQIGTVVSEKIRFEFLYVHDLGPRSRNDLALQHSHIFIYSIRCLLPLTFRLLTAIRFEKSTIFTFSFRKA